MAKDISEAIFVGRNNKIYTLLDQVVELEGKGFMHRLFFGFQVPVQSHIEELNHNFSPTVSPFTTNSINVLCLTDSHAGCLICSASDFLPVVIDTTEVKGMGSLVTGKSIIITKSWEKGSLKTVSAFQREKVCLGRKGRFV